MVERKPDDIFDANQGVCKMTANDYYLLESYQITKSEPQPATDWRDRSQKAFNYKKILGTKIATVTTLDQTDQNFDQNKFDYAWWSTLLFGFDAMGWGEYQFSASGQNANKLEYRPRPNPGAELVSSFTSSAVVQNGDKYTRTTNGGTITINTTTLAAAFTVTGDVNFTGKIGVGVESPVAPIHVRGNPVGAPWTQVFLEPKSLGDGGSAVALKSRFIGDEGLWYFGSGSGSGPLTPTAHNGFRISNMMATGNPDYFIVSKKGDVGLGSKVGINGPDLLGNATLKIWATGGPNGAGKIELAGEAYKSQGTGNWLISSDKRLKKNITPLDPNESLEKMMALQGVRFEWSDDKTGFDRPKGVQYGFIAQNVQSVYPGLVNEDARGYLMTSYGTYDAMTVESIRALNNKIEKMELENAQLKSLLAAQQTAIQELKDITASLKKELTPADGVRTGKE